MKKNLLILDGIVAKKLLDRISNTYIQYNAFDIVYTNSEILPEKQSSVDFTFYNFDATSYSKLYPFITNNFYNEIFIVLQNETETLNVISNIRLIKTKINLIVYDNWGIEIDDDYIQYYKSLEIVSNGLFEKLPDIPIVAQNIGLRQGEIMEIKIPFGSLYAYRYIGSIVQKGWKICALYRNETLITIRPSLIIKPYDLILIVGKPKVLNNIYNLVSQSIGQFPVPFGKNIYLYLNLKKQKKDEILTLVNKAIILHRNLQSSELIVKIVYPSTSKLLDEIKSQFSQNDTYTFNVEYRKINFIDLIESDAIKYRIGLLVIGLYLLKEKHSIKKLLKIKLPIFKSGMSNLDEVKQSLVILHDQFSYEQIASTIFDISSQFKIKMKLYDMNPIGQDKDTKLVEYFEELSTIFNKEISIVNTENNPIKELEKETKTLQILPLKTSMFKRRFMRFLSLNTDLLSFDMKQHNQILIPINED